MRLMEEFVRRVMVESNSFDIQEENRNRRKNVYHFMQDYIGKARYIYGRGFWDTTKINGNIKNKYDLMAIVCDDVVYIVDKYFFGCLGDKTPGLPNNVRLFNDAVEEANEYARDVLFPKYCDGLNVDAAVEDEFCLREARRAIFTGKSYVLIDILENFLSADDLGNILCGFASLEDVVLENLEKSRERYEMIKGRTLKINELIKSRDVVKPYELEIVRGLNSVSAKSVTVEFEVNGKIASGKMEPNTIINILYRNDYISDWYFTTSKRGEEIRKELGIKSYGEDCRELYPSDITKITYGKKVLYERK